MLLGVVLLYVGAVLAVNGIWLIGQAQAAEAGPDSVVAAEAEAGEELAGRSVTVTTRAPAPPQTRLQPLFIQNREVAVLNVFTGFVGVVAATIFVVQGTLTNNLASVRGGGYVLLFAFTYLWVTINQFLNAGGHAFGWYCLFVAITAIPAGIYTLQSANGNNATIWLGINWFAWALLWAMFWALLVLELPIAKVTGWVAIAEGIGTSWAFAIALLEGKVAFPPA
jgi:putative amide transporter protein